jgi:hypothetical protein
MLKNQVQVAAAFEWCLHTNTDPVRVSVPGPGANPLRPSLDSPVLGWEYPFFWRGDASRPCLLQVDCHATRLAHSTPKIEGDKPSKFFASH